MGYLYIPRDRPHPSDKRVDWIGAVMITTGQLLLTLALTLSVSANRGWKAPCEFFARLCAETYIE
jgi:DHA2 family multidrug resistance protein-like MFS transporter